MSNIDKQALRADAVRAGGVKWQYMRATQHSKAYITDDKGSTVVNCTDGDVPANCAGFLTSANPATVLALLDELEAAERRIAELEAREVKLPNPHAHLIWIQAGHAPDDYWDDVAISHSEKDKCCDGSNRYPVYALWEIKEALSAIGVNIAAAGKGE